MSDFTYEVIERIATLSENNDWSKELRLVSFNGRPPRLDIREWNESEGRMSKGIGLTDDEAKKLYDALKSRFE